MYVSITLNCDKESMSSSNSLVAEDACPGVDTPRLLKNSKQHASQYFEVTLMI